MQKCTNRKVHSHVLLRNFLCVFGQACRGFRVLMAPILNSVHYILMSHNEIGFGLNSLCNQKSGLLKEKVIYIFATFKSNKYFYQN